MCIIIHSSMAIPVVGILHTVLLLYICITIFHHSLSHWFPILTLLFPDLSGLLPTLLLIVHKYPLFFSLYTRKWNCITMSVCKCMVHVLYRNNIW